MSIHDSKSITSSNNYKFTIVDSTNPTLSKFSPNIIQRKSYIENKKNGQTYIKGLGQLVDQSKNNFWFIPIRKSNQNAGVGKLKFIDVSENYNFLLTSKCNYAINYFENRSFFKVLCK